MHLQRLKSLYKVYRNNYLYSLVEIVLFDNFMIDSNSVNYNFKIFD
jgi:hypothetical protein